MIYVKQNISRITINCGTNLILASQNLKSRGLAISKWFRSDTRERDTKGSKLAHGSGRPILANFVVLV